MFRTHPDDNDGIRMLRRGYNFADGNDAQGLGPTPDCSSSPSSTLPGRFARVHTSMARDDLFTEYLKTNGSAVFLVPPGVQGQDFGREGPLRRDQVRAGCAAGPW